MQGYTIFGQGKEGITRKSQQIYIHLEVLRLKHLSDFWKTLETLSWTSSSEV